MIHNKSIILKTNDKVIYAVSEDGVFQIFAHNIVKDTDELWVKGLYTNMKFLRQSSSFNTEKYYYVILKGLDGEGRLVELFSGTTLLENICFEDFVGHNMYTCYTKNTCVKHFELRFNNKQEKEYYVLSAFDKKYNIGPIKYNSIEIYRNGVIIDKTLAIENDGRTIDLSEYDYSERSRVYINKEKKRYLVKFDHGGRLFYDLNKSREKGILIVRLDRSYRFYNIAEDRLYSKEVSHIWTNRELFEAAGIAYEGHSGLELGYE